MSHLRLLLPAFATVAREAHGPLTAWLARGDRVADVAPGRAAAIARCFALVPKPSAAAAITREQLAHDARGATWLRADPGYARADMASLRLMRCGDLGLGVEEAQQLLTVLRPIVGDAGFELSAPHPDRWFLRGITHTDTPNAEDPADILGDDLQLHLPSTPKWRRLLGEVQISLHNHPLNAARVERGQLPANTVWFWGAGALPDRVQPTAGANYSGTDELIVAHYAAAGVVAPASLAQLSQSTGGSLVECWSRPNWDALLASLDALQAGLKRRAYDAIEIECWTGERFIYRRPHRWRILRALKNPEATARA